MKKIRPFRVQAFGFGVECTVPSTLNPEPETSFVFVARALKLRFEVSGRLYHSLGAAVLVAGSWCGGADDVGS